MSTSRLNTALHQHLERYSPGPGHAQQRHREQRELQRAFCDQPHELELTLLVNNVANHNTENGITLSGSSNNTVFNNTARWNGPGRDPAY